MKRSLAPVLSVLVALAAAGCQRRPAPPQSTRLWIERHAPGETIIGLRDPKTEQNPIVRQAEELILGPTHRPHSLLWLQVLGATHLVSDDADKYRDVLEAERCERGGWCVYQTPTRMAASAVLVSRRRWKALPRLRSLYDRAALEAYVEWTDRPEAAGFGWTGPQSAEINADVGPDDMILVRQIATVGWKASIDGRPIECLRDPIGFLLLDAGRAGLLRIALSAPDKASQGEAGPLPTRLIPVINSGGVVDGINGTLPPLRPGRPISIYGTDLAGGGTPRVLVAGRSLQVLYASELQINTRLPDDLPPGQAEIVVETGGNRSEPVTIEIRTK